MPSLKIHAEGHCEYEFADKYLKPHLLDCGYDEVFIMSNKTSPGHSGGIVTYSQFKKNTIRLSSHGHFIVTTMIDLYRLPYDFPGMDTLDTKSNPGDRIAHLEDKLSDDLQELSPKFIPYIQLHEFEALLFADIDTIDEILKINRTSKLSNLKNILYQFGQAEYINTHKGPSKHLSELYPNYGKKTEGLRIADKIGLDSMRAKCPHFNEWLKKLEDAV
jgi:hypothetical protein